LNRPIAKTRMWQKHKVHFANFDMATLRVIWFRWGRIWVAGTSKCGFDSRRGRLSSKGPG